MGILLFEAILGDQEEAIRNLMKSSGISGQTAEAHSIQ